MLHPFSGDSSLAVNIVSLERFVSASWYVSIQFLVKISETTSCVVVMLHIQNPSNANL